jgi:hypothetical protein
MAGMVGCHPPCAEWDHVIARLADIFAFQQDSYVRNGSKADGSFGSKAAIGRLIAHVALQHS